MIAGARESGSRIISIVLSTESYYDHPFPIHSLQLVYQRYSLATICGCFVPNITYFYTKRYRIST